MATEDGVAVVTGAAQGIGKSIANCLLSQGYKVFLFDIDITLGGTTCKDFQTKYGETKVSFIHCDVSDTENFTDAFNEVLKTCGHISVMVNNAGIIDEHNIQRSIDVNLTGAIHGSNLAICNMRKDQGGNGGIIVNIASMAALGSYHFIPTYCATKSGILSFTTSWATHPKCEELGLAFMCICPGFADTQLAAHGASKTLDPPFFEAAAVAGLLPLQSIENAFEKLMNDKQNGSALEVSIYRTGYLINTFLLAQQNETENA